MCGRFTLRANLNRILDQFAIESAELEWTPRYNIAPTQQVLVVRQEQGRRQLVRLRWGLVPSWADDPKIGNNLINARADTVADKPAFRSALKKHRCLVVADGFYEWQQRGKQKQPIFFRLKNDRPFAFAGLAERWCRADQLIESCTIITTDANELLSQTHHRMPVILPPENHAAWLDSELQDRDKLLPLLRPYPATEMTAIPVSTLVNNPKNESLELKAIIDREVDSWAG